MPINISELTPVAIQAAKMAKQSPTFVSQPEPTQKEVEQKDRKNLLRYMKAICQCFEGSYTKGGFQDRISGVLSSARYDPDVSSAVLSELRHQKNHLAVFFDLEEVEE
jgi:hypothetical protein